MLTAKEKIEKRFVIPCGAMDVDASKVCRRQLKDKFDSILDRITEAIHPEFAESTSQQNSLRNEALQDEETAPERKVKTTKSQFVGNSKMLQDPTGKIKDL